MILPFGATSRQRKSPPPSVKMWNLPWHDSPLGARSIGLASLGIRIFPLIPAMRSHRNGS